MLVCYYFDWAGSREGLTSWVEAVRAEAEQQNIEFLGLFGPSQMKFNWSYIFRVENQEHYQRLWRNLTMPAEVTHAIIHYFWPDKSFMRDLPRYPPAHFFRAE